MNIRSLKFVLFGDFKRIEAQPDTIIKISSKLLENGIAVMPGTFQQFNPIIGLKPIDRMMFHDTNEKLNIHLGIESIEINIMITDNKDYNYSAHTNKFLSNIKKIIKSLNDSIENFPLGTRVSFITEIIYDTQKIESLEEVYSKYNQTLPNFSKEETIEWTTRAVKRLNLNILAKEEVINIINEVSRNTVEINNSGNLKNTDTITTRSDINTILNNTIPRIDNNFVDVFLEESNKIFNSQNSEIEVGIIGNHN